MKKYLPMLCLTVFLEFFISTTTRINWSIWNKKHEEMTGDSSEELLQMGPLDWFKGDENSIASAEEGIKKTFQEGFGDAEAILEKKRHKNANVLHGCPIKHRRKTILHWNRH